MIMSSNWVTEQSSFVKHSIVHLQDCWNYHTEDIWQAFVTLTSILKCERNTFMIWQVRFTFARNNSKNDQVYSFSRENLLSLPTDIRKSFPHLVSDKESKLLMNIFRRISYHESEWWRTCLYIHNCPLCVAHYSFIKDINIIPVTGWYYIDIIPVIDYMDAQMKVHRSSSSSSSTSNSSSI